MFFYHSEIIVFDDIVELARPRPSLKYLLAKFFHASTHQAHILVGMTKQIP